MQIDELKGIAKSKMSVMQGTAHSYAHVDRVERIAVFLAEKEKADVELVQVGSILHDVGWSVGHPHNENGAIIASEILKELDYPEKKRQKVVSIVKLHCLEFGDRLQTLEEKTVWDADKIDLLGVVGVARGFHWCGRQPFEAAVKLAYETYAPIYGMLHTSSARELAKKRNEETMHFLSALHKELSLADLGIR